MSNKILNIMFWTGGILEVTILLITFIFRKVIKINLPLHYLDLTFYFGTAIFGIAALLYVTKNLITIVKTKIIKITN